MASRSLTEEEAFWARSIGKSYIGWNPPTLPPVRTVGTWAPAPIAPIALPVIAGQFATPAASDSVFLPPVAGKGEEVELVPVDKKNGDAPAVTKDETYTVQKGDTLGGIAKKYYGSANDWQRILNNNKDVLTSPTQLKPGMRLKIPSAPGGK